MPERNRGREVSLTNKPGHRISDLEFQAFPKSRSSMVLMTIVNESVSAKVKKDSDIHYNFFGGLAYDAHYIALPYGSVYDAIVRQY